MKKALFASSVKAFHNPIVFKHVVAPKPKSLAGRIGTAVLSVVVGIFVIGTPVAYVAFPAYQIFDERRTHLVHSVGVVTWYSNATQANGLVATIRNSGNQLVGVRVDFHDAYFSWPQPVRIGQQFSIDYRVGKSGRVYVDGARLLLHK